MLRIDSQNYGSLNHIQFIGVIHDIINNLNETRMLRE